MVSKIFRDPFINERGIELVLEKKQLSLRSRGVSCRIAVIIVLATKIKSFVVI